MLKSSFQQGAKIVSLVPVFLNSKHRLELITDDPKDQKKEFLPFQSLDVDNLTYSYEGGETILENFRFSINRGDKIVIRGKNGCGKSTLFDLIFGLLENYQGQIKINDAETVNGESLDIVYCPADIFILEDERYYQEIDEDIKEALNLDPIIIRIRESGFLHLSNGERKRLSLAHCLMRRNAENSLILLDEPTNWLDLQSISGFLDYISCDNCSYLVVSHDTKLSFDGFEVFEMRE